ncbi:MAG: RHS repeat-associated core domain-containing protein, partial [Chlamydiia bacterium]|nr:RHS repeat-associated core domain-containing protein [Chlamydiia bacterium]
GLILFGYRFYDPALGRFTTADPAGYDAGPNLWAYCHNNPLVFSDLFGLCPHTTLYENSPSHDDHSEGSTTPDARTYEPSYESLGDLIRESVKEIVEIIATGVEAVMNNSIIRAPGFLEAGYAIERSTRQGTYHDHQPVCPYTKSEWITYGTYRPHEDFNIVLICGMGTSYETAFARAESLSERLGGVQVHVFVPGSNSYGNDSIHCGLNRLGFSMEAFNTFKQGMERIVQDTGPNGTVMAAAF